MPRTDVLVLGDANPDLVLRGDVVPRFGQAEQLLDAADLTLGGSGAIAACGLARLGLDVALVAAVGTDAFGELTLDHLRTAGVDVRHVVRRDEVPTGLSVILSGEDRAILTLPGAIPTLGPDDVPDLAGARHVHAASPYLVTALRPALPALLGAARSAGATTSLDTNDDPARSWADLRALLGAADVALPNEGELLAWAAALGGEPVADWAAAAALVAALGPAVVVKRGGDGGAVVTPDGALEQAPEPVRPLDTTGAGDSFDAGYVAALVTGHDPVDALRWAVAAGTAATQRAGGTGRQVTRAEVEAAARRLP